MIFKMSCLSFPRSNFGIPYCTKKINELKWRIIFNVELVARNIYVMNTLFFAEKSRMLRAVPDLSHI